jgi:hypothetical protein
LGPDYASQGPLRSWSVGASPYSIGRPARPVKPSNFFGNRIWSQHNIGGHGMVQGSNNTSLQDVYTSNKSETQLFLKPYNLGRTRERNAAITLKANKRDSNNYTEKEQAELRRSSEKPSGGAQALPSRAVVSITYEEIGLFPRSFSRVLDRFLKQLFSDVDNLVIQEYRFYRYLFLTTIKTILILFFVPFVVNVVAKHYVVKPITEYFWNTQHPEIFLNSHEQKRAFAELEKFEEKNYFDALVKYNMVDHSKPLRGGPEIIPGGPPSGMAQVLNLSPSGTQSREITSPSPVRPSNFFGNIILLPPLRGGMGESDKQDVILYGGSGVQAPPVGIPFFRFSNNSDQNNPNNQNNNNNQNNLEAQVGGTPREGSADRTKIIMGDTPLKPVLQVQSIISEPREFPAQINMGGPPYITDMGATCGEWWMKDPLRGQPGSSSNREGAPILPGLNDQYPTAINCPPTGGPTSRQLLGTDFFKRYQEKTVELATHYNNHSIDAITNFFADLLSLCTLLYLLITFEIQINITKSFLAEVFFGLDDSQKSLLILLVTDLLVGYHSSNLWELFFEFIFHHYGIPESQTGIFLLVATLPVLLDVLFKYLIFRHLNRSSPATVATYQAIIE